MAKWTVYAQFRRRYPTLENNRQSINQVNSWTPFSPYYDQLTLNMFQDSHKNFITIITYHEQRMQQYIQKWWSETFISEYLFTEQRLCEIKLICTVLNHNQSLFFLVHLERLNALTDVDGYDSHNTCWLRVMPVEYRVCTQRNFTFRSMMQSGNWQIA